jgi:CheY-like chemotaxis protein/HPt (histidine-containing phosphotransfer) domain-containing protein
MMGGTIRVRSTLGQGSSFWVVLPTEAVAGATPQTGAGRLVPSDGRRLAGLRLLVAEDNEVNRLVLESLLTEEGAQVTLVADGRAAVEAIGDDGVGWDLVLMDVQMPELDGLEATRRILARVPEMRIVGQTAHALAEEQEECLAAGMVDRVTKPIEHEELIAAVLRHARRRPASERATASRAAAIDGPGEDAVQGSPARGIVDWEALRERYRDHPGMVERIVALMLKFNHEVPARLRLWAAAGDLHEIGKAAHDLKGAAGNLMAHATEDLANRVQLAARTGAADTPALALELADALDRLLAALADRHETRNAATRWT